MKHEVVLKVAVEQVKLDLDSREFLAILRICELFRVVRQKGDLGEHIPEERGGEYGEIAQVVRKLTTIRTERYGWEVRDTSGE
jgi:hypothetical protein